MGKYTVFQRAALIGGLVIALPLFVLALMPQGFKLDTRAASGEPVQTDKVIVCHKAGQSGNYTRNEVSLHSVNDANGLNGHGNHNGDIWAPFTYNSQNYSGQGDYNGTNFSDCSKLPTPTPTPTPNGDTFVFPSCSNVLPQEGDKAHFAFGIHQIVGGPLLWGSDDVYTLDNGNFLQCFCPVTGTNGIQTNWLRSVLPVDGWFFENGSQWNLGNYTYAAQNVEFRCGGQTEEDPTPLPSPTPSDPGITVVHDGRGDGLGCAVNDCSGNQVGSAIEGYGIGGQVLGASTMAAAGSFDEMFYQAIMGIGATLSAFGIKGLKKAKKRSKK